ncbi:MAG: ATP-binding protein, partial [Chromatiaceae bacterium]|nr:ATP-binding protein [Chromatiaceae bacterium]
MRFFNTEGPVRSDKHYCLAPLQRWDLEEVLSLIDLEKYFLLHAPRQTGKTTCLLALMNYLNRDGRYRALYVNIEAAQSARERVEQGMAIICSALGRAARLYLGDARPADWCSAQGREIAAGDRLAALLEYWAGADSQPLVLLLDEVDTLVGDTLISLLRQLRAGYPQRPNHFPHTVVLCGVRDLRDYRIHSSAEQAIITGGSAFNIKAKSLRLGDFSR